MGNPKICQNPLCHATKNSLLAEECRECGESFSTTKLNSSIEPGIQFVPSAIWKTQNIPDLWREARESYQRKSISSNFDTINLHDVLKYAHLLNALRSSFDSDNATNWFDDCLFFLRGGYDFFCNLNLTSEMSARGTIFGGLNHGRRPKEELRQWVDRILDAAKSRNQSRLDIFIADEVNSGNGTRQIIKSIHAQTQNWAKLNNHDQEEPREIHLWFYLLRDSADHQSLQNFLNQMNEQKAISKLNNLDFQIHIKYFTGPLLVYDSEIFSGLKVVSKGADESEQYQIVVSPTRIAMPCCKKGGSKNLYIPSSGDVADDLNQLILELTKPSLEAPLVEIIKNEIFASSCDECKQLFDDLESGRTQYKSETII